MWGSQIPLLVELLNKTDGPVLELGAGWFTTPLIYWMCLDKNREFSSYDTNLEWVLTLDPFTSLINDYAEAPIDRHWNVVHIDHAPCERRIVDIKRLIDYTDYFIVHDTEPENDDLYRFSEIYPLFKYRLDYTKHKPYTTILSNKYGLQ